MLGKEENMSDKPNTPLLDDIKFPEDVRKLEAEQLRELADEVRADMIYNVSRTGGHLGAGLGVVELTTAIHYVFNTPKDKLIWDVGHQCYPHKILTGRREKMNTIRKGGGLAGFTKRKESEYDAFGAGHSSTSISAGLGMAVARDLTAGRDVNAPENVIAVIGDGAMSAGMAYEAMNNAGALKSRLIVILNDNDMSIAPPVGAMSAYLARLLSSRSFLNLRDFAKNIVKKFPKPISNTARKAEEYARGMATGGTLFEELGFYYVGPVDGHNMEHLLPVLENVRDAGGGPILIHVVTEKGKGYRYAENAEKIVAINAAMPSGTGLDKFAEEFPDRCFDVGIAEQHAVTFAAGLACEGYKPFATIYSTFLQRAYDQVVHDVAVQNLPVRFAIDRAGLVGADGPTHAGSFDVTYLASLPNIVVMAAADEADLMHMIATAAAHDTSPSAVRYPRGEGMGVTLPDEGDILEIGKGRIVREGKQIAILSLGTRLEEALKAADEFNAKGLSCTVADARFAKPLDIAMIRKLALEHEVLITIEEGSIGGFGSHVLDYLSNEGLLEAGLKVRTMKLPDVFIDQGNPADMYEQAGLTSDDIVRTALHALGHNDLTSSQVNG